MAAHEIFREGDIVKNIGVPAIGLIGSKAGPNGGGYRKIQSGEWLPMKYHDGDSVTAVYTNDPKLALEQRLNAWIGFGTGRFSKFPDGNIMPTHFMLLPVDVVEDELPVITINSDGENVEVEFGEDGSITVGCTTVVSEIMDKIIERRKEVKK